jgi:hypothetical protein
MTFRERLRRLETARRALEPLTEGHQITCLCGICEAFYAVDAEAKDLRCPGWRYGVGGYMPQEGAEP